MKDTFRQIFNFFVLCVSLLSIIGGTAYLFYDGHALFGVTNLMLAAMALPYIVPRIKEIIK